MCDTLNKRNTSHATEKSIANAMYLEKSLHVTTCTGFQRLQALSKMPERLPTD